MFKFSNRTPSFAVFGNLIVFVTDICLHSDSSNPIGSEVFIPPNAVIDSLLEFVSSDQLTTFSFSSNSNIRKRPVPSTVLPDALANAENV